MFLPAIIRIGVNTARDFDSFSAFYQFFAALYEFLNRLFRQGVIIAAAIDGVIIAKRKNIFGIRQPLFNAERAGQLKPKPWLNLIARE